MPSQRLIVLKFGSSVLRSESTLRLAVHEIYRWRRDGYGVVAVVSALAGQTDELLRRSREICTFAAPQAVASLVSTGELQAASLLGLQLDRAGVPACVLTPSSLGLVARGQSLDAEPVAMDSARLAQAIGLHGVVVVPGYVAEDDKGRTVLLGRGGSDLTALFLAHQLRASICRLVKDVDGLYESDPSRASGTPKRFDQATWDDALGTDGSIVQSKAVRFAKANKCEFELGRLNGTRPTRIGFGPTSFTSPDRQTPLRVSLLGLGTVGGGVFELLSQLPGYFHVTAVAVQQPDKRRTPAVRRELLTTSAVGAARCGADVVVELMGGLDPAGLAVEAAMESGANVVTANKTLVAQQGLGAGLISQANGVRCSASVGGSMPLLERVGLLSGRGIRSVRGILNGTTNYLLDELSRGVRFDAAVRSAQTHGFAESDPSRDLAGLDAADKLCVIAQRCGAGRLSLDSIDRAPLSAASAARALAGAPAGRRLRHVATIDLADDVPRARVELACVGDDDPLASVDAEQNAAVIALHDGTSEDVRGRGAGRWPTAESVVADLLELARCMPATRGVDACDP